MEWQSQLITTYVTVCDAWRKGCFASVQRHSNNSHFALSDEEVVTIYLFGISSGHVTVRGIYDYACRHLRDWFPELRGYESFSYRLNKVSSGFMSLCQFLVESQEKTSSVNEWVIDSLPVVIAGPRRSGTAKVFSEFANKGYCASKNLYFYGVKIHVIGNIRSGSIPMPSYIGLTPASESDFKMFEQVSKSLKNGKIYGDLAYCDSTHTEKLEQDQNVEVRTPRKKKNGHHSFSGSDIYSSCVSAIRQPIESLFNWLQEKTRIQNASKVRSSNGLLVHVFGKISAALMMQIGFNL